MDQCTNTLFKMHVNAELHFSELCISKAARAEGPEHLLKNNCLWSGCASSKLVRLALPERRRSVSHGKTKADGLKVVQLK